MKFKYYINETEMIQGIAIEGNLKKLLSDIRGQKGNYKKADISNFSSSMSSATLPNN